MRAQQTEDKTSTRLKYITCDGFYIARLRIAATNPTAAVTNTIGLPAVENAADASDGGVGVTVATSVEKSPTPHGNTMALAPTLTNALPATVVPCICTKSPNVIGESIDRVAKWPLNVDVAPNVAAPPIHQLTASHDAPPFNTTTLFAAVLNAAGVENK